MEAYVGGNFVPMAVPDIWCLTSSNICIHIYIYICHALPLITLYKVTKCKEKMKLQCNSI